MPMGRPATPIEVKRRRGTLRKDRTPTALAIVPVADAAAFETLGALGEALMTAGASAWISRTDQIVLLGLLERGWMEMESLRARWIASDYSNEAVARRLGKVEENLTRWLSLLGLSPTDRSRLGLAEVKARSKLEELTAKRSEREGGRRAT